MRIIKTESGKSFSINSRFCPALSLKIPLNATLIKDPDFSVKVRKPPLRNSRDNSVISDR
jgi:hypothetical protein